MRDYLEGKNQPYACHVHAIALNHGHNALNSQILDVFFSFPFFFFRIYSNLYNYFV